MGEKSVACAASSTANSTGGRGTRLALNAAAVLDESDGQAVHIGAWADSEGRCKPQSARVNCDSQTNARANSHSTGSRKATGWCFCAPFGSRTPPSPDVLAPRTVSITRAAHVSQYHEPAGTTPIP
jgi:hypothetical protein